MLLITLNEFPGVAQYNRRKKHFGEMPGAKNTDPFIPRCCEQNARRGEYFEEILGA